MWIVLAGLLVASVLGMAVYRGMEAHEMAKARSEGPPGPSLQGSPNLTAITVGLYQRAMDSINQDVAASVKRLNTSPLTSSAAFKVTRGRELADQISATLRGLDAQAGPAVRAAMTDAAKRGVSQAHEQLRREGVHDAAARLGLDGGSEGATGFAVIDTGAVETIARDSLARMRAAAGLHAENAGAVFRSLSQATPLGARQVEVNEIIARGIITGNPRDTQRGIREVFRDPGSDEALTYRRLGAQQIEVGGWTGTVRDYAELVAVTRTREATIDARHDRLEEAGIELVQVTGNNTVNFCTRFIGLICALSEGATDGGKYPLLSSLPGGGPPFHPRCSKGTAAFVPGLSSGERAASGRNALERFRRAEAAGTLEDDFRTVRRTA